MNNKIRVVVSGAGGRMGKEVVKLVLQDEELELAAAVDRSSGDIDAGRLVGLEDSGVIVTSDLEAALAEATEMSLSISLHRSQRIRIQR